MTGGENPGAGVRSRARVLIALVAFAAGLDAVAAATLSVTVLQENGKPLPGAVDQQTVLFGRVGEPGPLTLEGVRVRSAESNRAVLLDETPFATESLAQLSIRYAIGSRCEAEVRTAGRGERAEPPGRKQSAVALTSAWSRRRAARRCAPAPRSPAGAGRRAPCR